MFKTRKTLIVALFMLFSSIAFSQTILKGSLVDTSNGEPIIGANVTIVGTTTGAISDYNGHFSFEAKKTGEQKLSISFVGMQPIYRNVSLKGGLLDLGTLKMEADAIGLEEVEVMASIAVDRKTPVAAASISAEDIETKVGNQEFPQVLKSTPGVYVSGAGGGFGDSRISLRGFDSENVAVMINGVPVNDMENGKVYWSNWAGLNDVTKTMQVQRGLGASKLAVPSVGGTINIITKATDAQKGGSVYMGVGNDGYFKTGLTLSTGLMKNGFAVTTSLSRTLGNGYVDGTPFEGYSYFLNVAKQINKKHTLSFTTFGAPQSHGQRRTYLTDEEYNKYGNRYNADWGYKDGKAFNTNVNSYHKPQMSLNWYWTINDKTDLATTAYVSVGRGGGTGLTSNAPYGQQLNVNDFRNENGIIDFDAFVRANQEQFKNSNGQYSSVFRKSHNNHLWAGAVSTLTHKANDYWTITGGIDLRNYKGQHYQTVEDLMGNDYYIDRSNQSTGPRKVRVGDKMGYNNDGIVQWQGLFGQVEYSKDQLTWFMSAAASHQAYKRIDYFKYKEGTKETDWQSFFGGSIKTGANYNIDEHHNVFINAGFISRQPFMNAVFLNYKNDINKKATNEKILSGEIGYGYRTKGFRVNVNAYYTLWKDKAFTKTVYDTNGQSYTANLLGVDALHKGIELDAVWQPTRKLTVTAMASVGDWKWLNNLENVKIFDDQQNEIDEVNVFMKNKHVGNSAQTTAAIGVTYEVLPRLRVMGDWNFYGNLYADYDVTKLNNPAYKNTSMYRLPDYDLVDLGASYAFKIGHFTGMINLKVNNVFDTQYAVQGQQGGLNEMGRPTLRGYYRGIGRTYSIGLKISF
ncbi:TonB-dependent receptor [Flammeovirga sp. EKP202]|uniref:TonB-dependent receptor n=1 Tax=Flammeovirga sp. EKP202 TaxID=2770592 RepID=UPI00165F16A8|nr:TonB-dependent receptor [Flammeovirga sp. EKP202]MBD0401998.1 TonB-dependent receptor [Flammeovirga sp. EKP202]